MKTSPPKISILTDWFKKNTEGSQLMQWISYFMVFSVLVIFILEYPQRESWTGGFSALFLPWRCCSLSISCISNTTGRKSFTGIRTCLAGCLISLPICWFWEPSHSRDAVKLFSCCLCKPPNLQVCSGSGPKGDLFDDHAGDCAGNTGGLWRTR